MNNVAAFQSCSSRRLFEGLRVCFWIRFVPGLAACVSRLRRGAPCFKSPGVDVLPYRGQRQYSVVCYGLPLGRIPFPEGPYNEGTLHIGSRQSPGASCASLPPARDSWNSEIPREDIVQVQPQTQHRRACLPPIPIAIYEHHPTMRERFHWST